MRHDITRPRLPIFRATCLALGIGFLAATFGSGVLLDRSAWAAGKSASKAAYKVKLAGRTFRYAVGPYRIQVRFETETRLRWTYLAAPNNQAGKSAPQTFDRADLRPDVLMLAWTEANGTQVTDIYDLRAMRLYVSALRSGKQRIFLQAKMTEVK